MTRPPVIPGRLFVIPGLTRNLLLLALLLSTLTLSAQEVSVQGVVGENNAYGWFGGAAVGLHYPITKAFEADAGIEATSPGVGAFTLTARPVFTLPYGSLFLEGTFHSEVYGCYRNVLFVSAASIGYRMPYLTAQLGVSTRILGGLDRRWSSTDDYVVEPFDVLYRVACQVRPPESRWNLGAGVGNFTRFHYERSMQPIFFLDGTADLGHGLRFLAELDLRPTGMYHLTAYWYGFSLYAGVAYRFGK